MTSKQAKDFLTKELFIKKNVVRMIFSLDAVQHRRVSVFQVTFRSLSRELGIHVNDAKK